MATADLLASQASKTLTEPPASEALTKPADCKALTKASKALTEPPASKAPTAFFYEPVSLYSVALGHLYDEYEGENDYDSAVEAENERRIANWMDCEPEERHLRYGNNYESK